VCGSGVTLGPFSEVCGGTTGGGGPLVSTPPAPSDCVHNHGNELANQLCQYFEFVDKLFTAFCFEGRPSALTAAAIGLLTAFDPLAVVDLDEELWALMAGACGLVETQGLDFVYGSSSTVCDAWDTAIGE
jgi:hypothetical protein